MVVCQIHSTWQNGCVISHFNDWALIEQFPTTSSICIAIRSSNPSAPLLEFLTSLINQLLSNNFAKLEYKLNLLCTHCVQQITSEPFSYPISEIETLILKSQNNIMCKQKGSAGVPVSLSIIAPDLTFVENENVKINLKSEIEMEKEMLAEGAYGVLYKGIYKNEPVAVKLLRTEGASIEEQIKIFQEFRNEVSLMSVMNNENIVQLKGFCYGGEGGEIGMIMELVDCGDLHGLIKDKSKTLSIPMYLKIAFDIAQGLYFMHSLSPPILHRDLKPGNILLSHSNNKWKYTAKLADFGLSTKKYLKYLLERAVETPIWLSPEILSGDKYSIESDVFAFGIILYEMVERKLPYENFDFRFLNQLEEEIISGKRCDISHIEETNESIANLISSCWHNNPNNRPNFLKILKTLLNISVHFDNELYNFLAIKMEKILSQSVNINNQNLTNNNQFSNDPSNLSSNNHQNNVNSSGQLNSDHHITLTGKFIKKIQTNPPETISCMIVVGNDIWVAHKNGDISIWNSENGKLFRQIIAAHSREIQTMVLVGKRVWTGARDGMIQIWRSRAFSDVNDDDHQTTISTIKEGYLEPSDGSPATFISLHNGSKDINGFSLAGSITTPVNDQLKFGFNIQCLDGNNIKFFCANAKDRDEWVDKIGYATRNLSEKTQDLKIGQIAQKRRVQIHSLVYSNDRVYACVSDLFVRSYDPNTFEFIDESPLLGNFNWINASASGPRRDRNKQSTFIAIDPINQLGRKYLLFKLKTFLFIFFL